MSKSKNPVALHFINKKMVVIKMPKPRAVATWLGPNPPDVEKLLPHQKRSLNHVLK